MPAPEETTQFVHRDDTETQFPTDITGELRQATEETHKVEDIAAEMSHPLAPTTDKFIDTIAPDKSSEINTNNVEEAPTYQSQKPLLGSFNGSFTGSSPSSEASLKLKEKLIKLGQLDKAA